MKEKAIEEIWKSKLQFQVQLYTDCAKPDYSPVPV